MHDAAFAGATRPTRVAILRGRKWPFQRSLPLRAYTIGHELLLQAARNALVTLDLEAFDALPLEIRAQSILHAGLICANNWEQNQLPQRWVNLWARTRDPLDILPSIAAFREYRSEALRGPVVKPHQASEGARMLGGPYLARLVVFLMRELRWSELEAMDTPLSKAQFYYFTHAEEQGQCQLMTPDDFAFEAWCDEQDALEAAQKAA